MGFESVCAAGGCFHPSWSLSAKERLDEMTPRSWSRGGVTLLLSTMLVACNRDVAVPSGVASLNLKSSSFSGDTIPAKYSSCEGESSVSPALKWSAPPAGTQSFALIAIDRDSPFGFRFVHWVLFDLPPEMGETLPP